MEDRGLSPLPGHSPAPRALLRSRAAIRARFRAPLARQEREARPPAGWHRGPRGASPQGKLRWAAPASAGSPRAPFPRQAAVSGRGGRDGGRPRGASGTRGPPQSPRRPPRHQLRTWPRAGPTWPGVAGASSTCAQVTRRPRVLDPERGGGLLPAVRAGRAGGEPRRPSPRFHAAAGGREPSRVASRRERKVSPLLQGACPVPRQRAGEARGVEVRPPGS